MYFALQITVSFLGVVLALLGGALSVVSPCVLPILPGLAGVTTGLSLEDLENDNKFYRRIISMCVAFSIGFSIIFIAIGLVTTQLGESLTENKEQLTRISGIILILLSIFLLLSFFTQNRFFNFERKFRFKNSIGSIPVVLVGAGFALGWSPCLGPVLAGVLSVAASEQNMFGRILILGAYCVGLCLAMSAIIIASFKFKRVVTFIKKHTRAIVIFTFLLMFCFGLILYFDKMTYITARITHFFDLIGLDKISQGI